MSARADGFIEFETKLYSASNRHVADILMLKATEQEVSFYSRELELIARHERLAAGASIAAENPQHRLHPATRCGLERVKEAFVAPGEAAKDFLKGLQEKHPLNCGFHARYILRLNERYASEDIHARLLHAMAYYAYDGRAVERILKAKAQPRTLIHLGGNDRPDRPVPKLQFGNQEATKDFRLGVLLFCQICFAGYTPL